MMDTKDKILNAGIREFAKTGYLGTSTKTIAKSAGVAEMTLFRKFGSKKELFESMIRQVLGRELHDQGRIDFDLSYREFTKNILHQRLVVVSKNITLVRMIIQESLQGRLSDQLNYFEMMSEKLHGIFSRYASQHARENDHIAMHLSGIILHHAILHPSFDYHRWTSDRQNTFLDTCLSQLNLT